MKETMDTTSNFFMVPADIYVSTELLILLLILGTTSCRKTHKDLEGVIAKK
jgi:hypothetical protein